MAKLSTPREAYDKFARMREGCPLPKGNPYKLENARDSIRSMLQFAEQELRRTRAVNTSDRGDMISAFLREHLPFELGYAALPGLAVMGRPDLVNNLQAEIDSVILPEAAAILRGPSCSGQLACLVDLLRHTFVVLDRMLSAVEVGHV